MVIIANKAGQLGNRLFLFAHMIAHAMANNYQVLNPSFDEYAPFFNATRGDIFCRFPKKRLSTNTQLDKMLPRISFRVIRKLSYVLYRRPWMSKDCQVVNISNTHDRIERLYNLSSLEFSGLVRTKSVVFALGWLFRDFESLKKYSQNIKGFFTPCEVYKENITRLIQIARNDCDILVGVHIRQGDFKTFAGGRYYYETESYIQKMREISDLLGKDLKVNFLVASTTPQNWHLFKGLKITCAKCHIIEDMYSLAACDFLLGPPSTYSGWASFYGNVPLYKLENLEEPVKLEGFQVVDG